MRRRTFIGSLGGAALAAALPRHARAQQERVRRIGVLSGLAESDPESQIRMSAFDRGLRDLGWIKGRNLQVDYRWAGDGPALQEQVAQLVSLKPDLIFANSTPVAVALQAQTRTLPIVFVQVTDPIGQGLVANLAQPGGNLTGLTNFEFSIGGKWIEIAARACAAAGAGGDRFQSRYRAVRAAVRSADPRHRRRVRGGAFSRGGAQRRRSWIG